MLAGRMPFDGSYDTVMLAREILSATPHPLRQLIPDLPLHVEAAITQALAKDKGLRFPSVLDFVRALHGLPLSSTVHLRRDAPTAQLPYNERPTAALLDYSDRPTAALPLDSEPTAMLTSAHSPPVEVTALLPALQVSPSRPAVLAASALTPARPRGPERWRWRWLAAALSLVTVGATAGLVLPRLQARVRARGEAAALRLVSAQVVPTPSASLQLPWPSASEPVSAAASPPPGPAGAPPPASCSCPPLVAALPSADCPPRSGSASPAPGHRSPPARRRVLSKSSLSPTAVSRYLRRLD